MAAKTILKLSATIGIAAILAATSMVGAATGADGPVKQEKAGDGDRSRRVCRSVTLSGSHLPTRVCRTQAEWDEARDRTQAGVLRHQTNEPVTLGN